MCTNNKFKSLAYATALVSVIPKKDEKKNITQINTHKYITSRSSKEAEAEAEAGKNARE